MMTSRTGIEGHRHFAGASFLRGFTLMELILVMALLTVVAAMASPRLSRFLSGRLLDEECMRLIALTRYARSEAISRGVPTQVWISPAEARYGFEYLSPETESLPVSKEYTLKRECHFRLEEDDQEEEEEVVIQFWPDGTIDPSSIARVYVQNKEGEEVAVALNESGTNYLTLTPDSEEWYVENKTTVRND